ncbi:MAG: adenylosuccinate synthase [Candidatus Aenigmarchaeota archaeon]|nr:adenylosuccinate synthase [Candidatus Aenigmarchaeota archaeon]
MVDHLAERYVAVARYQGGHNAGHTVCDDNGNEYVFHMIDSGILYQNVKGVLGNGVVIEPRALRNEIETLSKRGLKITPQNFFISDQAHAIMPYHCEEEQTSALKKIGTTGRGIGPAYTDKTERSGIRMIDLYNLGRRDVRDRILARIEEGFSAYKKDGFNPEEVLVAIEKDFEYLKPFVTDTSALINDWLRNGYDVLAEGAQGALLDVDHGTYPFVTSSNTISGGACTGLGIPPTSVEKVIGVVKAYTTRVGNGPFPTELDDETGEMLRKRGKEYGATTGRPRRCGWEDLVVLSTTLAMNGVTEIALTKLDVLDTLPEIKTCTSYDLHGEKINKIPHLVELLSECKPCYDMVNAGWNESTKNITRYTNLPRNSRKYIEEIQSRLNVSIRFVSVGKQRAKTIAKY